ncbi:hypothetical protein [Streptomyces sp. SJL17-1]|uniref:hypothetical protein n=1 Tax=Streptomyces sp. SJL17-1 TaxID=2967223 RepID=UPI002966E42F|nr:hypothetical protein [Streptomyces sp. SJL17-1]
MRRSRRARTAAAPRAPPHQGLPCLRAAAPTLARRGGPAGLAAGLDALLDRFAPGAGVTG